MNWKSERSASVSRLAVVRRHRTGSAHASTSHHRRLSRSGSSEKSPVSSNEWRADRCTPFESADERATPHVAELRATPSHSLNFSASCRSLSLTLFNESPCPMLFKLKTTRPDVLVSQPARGLIAAHSFVECRLTPVQRRHPIVLVVQYATSVNVDDDLPTQWRQMPAASLAHKKFACSFDERPTAIVGRHTLNRPMLLTLAGMTLVTAWLLRRK
jgi:hypothetical protein